MIYEVAQTVLIGEAVTKSHYCLEIVEVPIRGLRLANGQDQT